MPFLNLSARASDETRAWIGTVEHAAAKLVDRAHGNETQRLQGITPDRSIDPHVAQSQGWTQSQLRDSLLAKELTLAPATFSKYRQKAGVAAPIQRGRAAALHRYSAVEVASIGHAMKPSTDGVIRQVGEAFISLTT